MKITGVLCPKCKVKTDESLRLNCGYNFKEVKI